MGKPAWSRLEKLNGGKPIMYIEPRLDKNGEVWFYGKSSEMRVYSRGQLAKHDPRRPPGAVTARATLYRIADGLVVDIEERGELAILRRGILNGSLLVTTVARTAVPSELAHYRALGFADGTPWNATKSRVTVRELRDERRSKKWTICVDGTCVIENWDDEADTKTRDAAIASAESKLAAKEKAGLSTALIELKNAEHANPEPKRASGAPARPAVAKAARFAKPKNPFEAVDTSIAILRDLHARIDRYHFIAECVDAKQDRDRVESVEANADFFLKMHRGRLGRWRRAKSAKPKPKESSWDYFVRTYGSLTWILDAEADRDLAMFYCGNVTGGGWSCLEIASDVYDTRDLAEALGEPDCRPARGLPRWLASR